MAQNLQIDPVKKDYVFQNGSPIPSNRVLEAAYYALLIPQNNWLYGIPNQGSLLYTMENTKRSSQVEQLFASFARDAINSQVVNNGQAKGVGIKNLSSSRTGTSNQVEIIPSAVAVSTQFSFNPV